MKKGLFHRRIPNAAAFIVLFLSIWVTTFLIQKSAIFVSRATPEKNPQNVIVSNITDSSFTVNFTTNSQTVAGISVEGDGAPYVVYDTRNKNSADQKPFYSHYIVVADLNPNTTYQFTILSDGESYLNNGQKYSVTTRSKITSSPPAQNPIVGRVLSSDGGNAGDTIVELSIAGVDPVTALTSDDGKFVIPTNSLRGDSLNSYVTLKPDSQLTINAYKQDSSAQVKVLFQNAANIPLITLSQTYDFTKASTQEAPTGAAQFKTPPAQIGNGEVRILTPTASQSFVDNQPLFRGTALPNQNVKITIESNPITATVRTDGFGSWSFRPTTPLAPGLHKITIQSTDKFGIVRTVSQTFTIFSSGSQVAQSATPSATPIVTRVPSPTPTRIPTAAPTAIPTAAPTSAISPTATLTPTGTITPTPTGTSLTPTVTTTITPTATIAPTAIPTAAPTLIAQASPTSGPIATPPPTGSSSSIILTITSLALILAGSALLFLL